MMENPAPLKMHTHTLWTKLSEQECNWETGELLAVYSCEAIIRLKRQAYLTLVSSQSDRCVPSQPVAFWHELH